MKIRILISTGRDPRRDGKVAEVIRIAAGLGAWGQVVPDVALFGPAVYALDSFPEELVDGHLIASYLTSIVSNGGEILVGTDSTELSKITPSIAYRTIKREEIFSAASTHTYSMTV